LSDRYPWNANVDGFSLHVLAVQRNAIAMLAEVVVAPRGAIPADDVDLAVEVSQFGQQIMQQVELPDVIVLLVAGTVVTKK